MLSGPPPRIRAALLKKIEARFEEYLLRVMRHAAQLAAPEDVAWFLASYARDGRARLEGVELAALETVRTALEEALGLKFEGEKGEHFFRSSLVQTLFYGVFSAWVLWSKQLTSAGFQPAQDQVRRARTRPPLSACADDFQTFPFGCRPPRTRSP